LLLSKEEERKRFEKERDREDEKEAERFKESEKLREKENPRENKENIPKIGDLQSNKEPSYKEEHDKEPFVNKTTEVIPRFYFPGGEKNASIDVIREIDEIFAAHKDELTVTQFEPVTTRIFKIPKFLNSMVFARVDKDKKGKVSKAAFLK